MSKNVHVNTGQDAFHFGIWINPLDFIITTFCEGDEIEKTCNNVCEFVKEVRALREWYLDETEYFGITGNEKLIKMLTDIKVNINAEYRRS